jgi:hypothetical protein
MYLAGILSGNLVPAIVAWIGLQMKQDKYLLPVHRAGVLQMIDDVDAYPVNA